MAALVDVTAQSPEGVIPDRVNFGRLHSPSCCGLANRGNGKRPLEPLPELARKPSFVRTSSSRSTWCRGVWPPQGPCLGSVPRMGDRIANGRMPENDWEFALSAANELVLWHQATADESMSPDRQTLTVVLVGCALHSAAVAQHLSGPALAHVHLDAALTTVSSHSLSALEAAPVVPGLGAEQHHELTRGSLVDEVRADAVVVLERHLADGGQTIADRAAALAQVRKAQLWSKFQQWSGDESG